MRWVGVSLVLASLAGPLSARAQEPGASDCPDDPTTCGSRAFDAGVEAYKRGAWQEALAHFKTAYGIRRYPIVLYNLALTEEKLGLYVEALGHVEELGHAPDRSADLTAKGKEVERRVARQIATLTLDLPEESGVTLFVDDRAMPGFDNVRVNPGRHRVRVVEGGKDRLRREVELQPGERFVLTPGEDGGTRESGGKAPEHRASTASPALDPIWFYVAAGATLAVAGVSVWSGMDTLSAKQRYDDGKPYADKAEEQSLLDDGHARERRTNVLLATTGVLALGTAAIGVFAVDWTSRGDKGLSFAPTFGGAALHGRY